MCFFNFRKIVALCLDIVILEREYINIPPSEVKILVIQSEVYAILTWYEHVQNEYE